MVAAMTVVLLLICASVFAAPPPSGAAVVTKTGTKAMKAKVTQVPGGMAQNSTVPTGCQGPMLKLGDESDEVLQVQKLLADSGFYTGWVDGTFGSGTLQAVKAFQAAHNLPVDGMVGKETILYMQRAVSAPSRYAKTMVMTATAYTEDDAGCIGITYSGHYFRRGLVAVDPTVIPLGTRLYIPGYGYAIADDTGGAIKGNRIDLAFESIDDAYQFGVQKVTVYIMN